MMLMAILIIKKIKTHFSLLQQKMSINLQQLHILNGIYKVIHIFQ